MDAATVRELRARHRAPRRPTAAALRATPEERARDRLERHRYGDAVEAIVDEESFATRVMFGCLGCYLHGRLVLVVADRREPFDGVLLPTAREHHASLRATFRALRVHPVLPKWLYLPARSDAFDDDARALAALARADDPRIGVEPAPRRTRRHARRAARTVRRRR